MGNFDYQIPKRKAPRREPHFRDDGQARTEHAVARGRKYRAAGEAEERRPLKEAWAEHNRRVRVRTGAVEAVPSGTEAFAAAVEANQQGAPASAPEPTGYRRSAFTAALQNLKRTFRRDADPGPYIVVTEQPR